MALSNFNKEDKGNNQSDSYILDRLRGDQKRSPADIRSVFSTSVSQQPDKGKECFLW